MVDVKPTDRLIFNLEMPQIDYNEAKKNALKQQIADKYNVPLSNVEVNFVPVTYSKNGEKVSLTSDIISNIQDPKFQQGLFREYIDLRKIEDADIDAILAIDESVNGFVDFDAYSRYKSYKFKYVKWDNYLSYGKGNYFDFTTLNGIVLLNGNPENQAGKTTFAIDLLRFALFGKADKSPSLDSVFNKYLPKETEVMVEAGIEIDGVDYVIRRTITRPVLSKRTAKSKAKQKIEYYKLISGNYELIENCEAESATQTNNIIRESVGTVEDFNLVISATSYTLGDLLRLGQTDRGKLFSKWLGLVTIEDKERIAKDMYKTQIAPKLLTNMYNKATLENEINDMEAVIASDEKEIAKLNERQTEVADKLLKLNEQKMAVMTERREIKEELIRTDITTVENQLKQSNDELIIKRGLFTKLKDEYAEVKDATFDKDEYDAARRKSTELTERIAETRTSIMYLRNEVKRIENLKAEGICPNCKQKIDVVEQDGKISELKSEEAKLIQQGVELKAELDATNTRIADLEKQRVDYERLSQLKLKLTAVKAQIDAVKLHIADLERQKSEIETNKDNILHNNEISNKIRLIDENIRTESQIKEDIIKKIQQFNSEISYYKKEIIKRNDIIKKLAEEEKVIRNWAIYQELVGKNGIVKIALKRALPVINNEIARLLNGLCDFNVEVVITEEGKVVMNLIRNNQILDLTYASSGYEGTMASLALRMALSSLGNMGKPNFLVLDEVLSGVAVSNHDNVKELYRRIIGNYDFIIHICHESTIEDIHDSVITVTKKDNVSVIETIAK